ncbi:hypothetical protein L4C31_01350 [Aliivibrio sifiae]
MKKILLVVLGLVLPLSANAFSVDTMVLVSDPAGNGVFTLTNNKSQPEYIKGEVSQVKVVNGNLNKVALTKDNLPMWDLAIVPTKFILNPGEQRRVAVKNLCQRNCKGLSYDKVYQIEFIPGQAPKEMKQSQIGIQMGYAPYFVVPAEQAKVKYDIQYNKGTGNLHINNQSNTFLYMQLDACQENKTMAGCKTTYTILAGRIRNIPLSDMFKEKDKLEVHIASHDYSYNENEYVSTK